MKDIFHFSSLDEVKKVAQEFIKIWGDHNVIAFYGQMGVGKTTLIKEICTFLGIDEIVTSPTFSIVNEYITHQGESVYHFDFYRVSNLEEAQDMGCSDYFYSGNRCFIEWPENIEPLLPPKTLKVHITLKEGELREVLINKTLA